MVKVGRTEMAEFVRVNTVSGEFVVSDEAVALKPHMSRKIEMMARSQIASVEAKPRWLPSFPGMPKPQPEVTFIFRSTDGRTLTVKLVPAAAAAQVKELFNIPF